MANKVLEGFDWFPSGLSSAERTHLWAANGFYETVGGNPVADVVTGRFGFGKAMSIIADTSGADTSKGYVIPIDDLLTEGFLAFALYYPSSNTSGTHDKVAFGFFDGVNDQYQLSVAFRHNGVIECWRGHPWSGTRLHATPVGSFEEDRWMVVEINPVIDDSAGSCEVRVNTVPKIQVTGADTRGGTVTTTFDSILPIAYTGPGGSFVNLVIDDFYFNDTAGATCSDWLGNLRVKTQFIIADGSIQDFSIGGTSPAATHWQSVLNSALDDTKYVYSPTIGDYDLYSADPNLNAPFVRCLQVRMALRQDDATQRSALAAIRIGAVTYDDDVEHFVNQDYTFYFGKWELNPATGVSFTGAEVNGLEVGIKVES
jgi:hypothetical protein